MMGRKKRNAEGDQRAIEAGQEKLAIGEVGVSGIAGAALTTQNYSQGNFGALPFDGIFWAINDLAEKAEAGDTVSMRSMLAGQAVALNAIFNEMARMAALNTVENLPAADTFLRLGLKAQAQSRATIEALDRLVHGREQTVRHVHVDNRGGQAVIAESVQTKGRGNGKSNKQSHTTGSACCGSPLLREDALRNDMPITSRERQTTLQDARRHKPRRA